MELTLGGGDIAVIGAILGALSGCITVLFKALIESKDKTLSEVIQERDYWRDQAMGGRVSSAASAVVPPHPPQYPQPPMTPPGFRRPGT